MQQIEDILAYAQRQLLSLKKTCIGWIPSTADTGRQTIRPAAH
jgi:hypothetical protein